MSFKTLSVLPPVHFYLHTILSLIVCPSSEHSLTVLLVTILSMPVLLCSGDSFLTCPARDDYFIASPSIVMNSSLHVLLVKIFSLLSCDDSFLACPSSEDSFLTCPAGDNSFHVCPSSEDSLTACPACDDSFLACPSLYLLVAIPLLLSFYCIVKIPSLPVLLLPLPSHLVLLKVCDCHPPPPPTRAAREGWGRGSVG